MTVKRYVDVEVLWTKDGNIIPTAIIWSSAEGTEYSGVAEPPIPAIGATPIPMARAT